MRTQAIVRTLLISATCVSFGCLPETDRLLRVGTVFAGREPSFAKAADLNGDGKQDLVVTRAWGKGEVSILIGRGDGTFNPPVNLVGSGTPGVPDIVDINGDGKLDLAIPNLVEGGFVSVLLGHGDGTFSEPINHVIGRAAVSLHSGDFNGDGKVDLLLVNTRPDANSATEVLGGKVTLLAGHGDGSFDAGRTVDVEGTPRSVAVGDVNGDGKPDLILANETRHELLVLLGYGDGKFYEVSRLPLRLDPLAVGKPVDMNKDGRLDLVIGVAGGVTILIGSGDGHFSHLADYKTEQTRSSWWDDFDHDGNVDIASAHIVLLGDGTGHFRSTALPHTANDDSFVVAADFNGDGWSDLVATDMNHNQIAVYLNRGGKPALSAAR